jgi:hypothetical protein
VRASERVYPPDCPDWPAAELAACDAAWALEAAAEVAAWAAA